MKKLLLITTILIFCYPIYGQCDQKLTFKSYKATEIKNNDFSEEISLEGTFTIDKDRLVMTLSANRQTQNLEAKILEIIVCEWTNYLQDGKTSYKTVMERGEKQVPTTIEIVSINGRTRLIMSSNPNSGNRMEFELTEINISDRESS
jgi:hypothetical protein